MAGRLPGECQPEEGDEGRLSFESWLERNPLPGYSLNAAQTMPYTTLAAPAGEGETAGVAAGGVPDAPATRTARDQRHQDRKQQQQRQQQHQQQRGQRQGPGAAAGGSGEAFTVLRVSEFVIVELAAVLEQLLRTYPRVDWDARRLAWVAYTSRHEHAATDASAGIIGSAASGYLPITRSPEPGSCSTDGMSPGSGGRVGTSLGDHGGGGTSGAPLSQPPAQWWPAVRVVMPRLAPRPGGFGGRGGRRGRRDEGEGWEVGPGTSPWSHPAPGGDGAGGGGGASGGALESYLSYLRSAGRCRTQCGEAERGVPAAGWEASARDGGVHGLAATANADADAAAASTGDPSVCGVQRRTDDGDDYGDEREATASDVDTGREAAASDVDTGREAAASDIDTGREAAAWVDLEVPADEEELRQLAAAQAQAEAEAAEAAAAAGGAALGGGLDDTAAAVPAVHPVNAALVLLSADSAALGVWRGGRLVRHKVLTGYTVRHSAGGSQARRDRQGGSGGGRSVGAALRRAEAARLWQAAAARLAEWAPELAACEVLVRSGDSRVWAQLYGARRPAPPVDQRDARWEAAGVGVPRPRLRDLLAVHRRLCTGRVEALGPPREGIS